MKLSRKTALELLAALRSLDGVAVNGVFSPFTLEPATIDRVVQDILTLKPLEAEMQAYRNEVLGKLGGKAVADPAHEKFPVLAGLLQEWLDQEVEVGLLPVSKDDLRTDVNRIMVGVRERLTLLDF